jgi:hypothetical protein
MKIKNVFSIIFGGQKIETKVLTKQSSLEYLLLKDLNKLYYVHKVRTKETVLIGTVDDAESLILYTINSELDEVKKLFIQQK